MWIVLPGLHECDLVNIGLVEFEDQRGYRIAPVTAANLAEITWLRTRLEAMALSDAIANAGIDWESGVLSALHRLTRCEAESPESRDAWEAAHTAFHLALVSGCGKPMLVDWCEMLLDLNERYRRLFVDPDSPATPTEGEHSAIAQAAAVLRDNAVAEAALRSHIVNAGRRLADQMDERARRLVH